MGIVADVYAYLSNLSPAVVDFYESGAWVGSEGWKLVRRDVNDNLGNQIVVITEDGGFEPETPSPTGIGDSALMEPAFQVRVRGEPNDGDGAIAKAHELFDTFHGLLRTQMGDRYYIRVKAQTPEPVPLGKDELGRWEFTMSFRALCAVAQESS